jgi:hypothetical protein
MLEEPGSVRASNSLVRIPIICTSRESLWWRAPTSRVPWMPGQLRCFHLVLAQEWTIYHYATFFSQFLAELIRLCFIIGLSKRRDDPPNAGAIIQVLCNVVDLPWGVHKLRIAIVASVTHQSPCKVARVYQGWAMANGFEREWEKGAPKLPVSSLGLCVGISRESSA